MRRIIATAFLLAVTGFAALSARAGDFEFPANQFGNLNLKPNQSLGGNDDFIQAQQNGVFEPLSEFNEDDAFREWSRPVGRLSMLIRNAAGEEGVATCTATLVSDNHVITNYHCIPGFDRNVQVLRAIVHFAYLRQDQESENGYTVRMSPVDANPDLDYSILQVEGSPGRVFGHVPIVPTRVAPNTSLYIFHHPAGLPLRLTRFRCKAYSGQVYAGPEFRHRCDTLGGSSGSLIFDANRNVVAVHRAGGLNASSQSSFNSGTDIFPILERSQLASLQGGSAPSSQRPAASPAPAIVSSPGAAPDQSPSSPVSGLPSATLPAVPQPPAGASSPAAPRTDLVDIRPGITGGFMNVRAGPGVGHAIVGQIPSGQRGVEIRTDTCRASDDGRTEDPWCRVTWRSVDGWISSSGFVGGIPGRAGASPQPAAAANVAMVRIRRDVSGGYMNVRSGPGTGHAIVGTIPAGASNVRVRTGTCRVSDDGRSGNPWCQVEWNGVSGWTSSGGFEG